jgi:AbrB family looped-hinge helix DNA binding protein
MSENLQHFQLLGTVTVGPKGQVVIPAEARERMGVAPGDKLIALYVNHKNTVCLTTQKELQAIVERMGSHIEGIREVLKNEK